MKKMMKLFAAAFVAIVAVSCVKENMENGGQNSDVKMVDVTFGADLNAADEDESKAHVGYDGDTPVMHWTKGDKVAVIDANTKEIYEFTLCGGENTSSGMFTGQVPEAALAAETQNWALVYPFSAVSSYKELGSRHEVYATLPTQQEAVNGGIAEGVNILVSGTTSFDKSITMFPVGNFIKIEIKGEGVTSFAVFNNDNQLSSGTMILNILPNTTKPDNSYMNQERTALSSNKVELVPAAGQQTISPGVYYLVYRYKHDKGLTLKFTNTKGEVAFYSSDASPYPGVTSPSRNITLDLGVWNAESMNWQKEEKVVLDFTSQPFVEELPTSKDTPINGAYTMPSSMRTVNIVTTAQSAQAAYTSAGLLFGTLGDYIEFPAIPGKKLKEIQVTKSSSKLTPLIKDGETAIESNPAQLYNRTVAYSHILPRAEVNKRYRYCVGAASGAARLENVTLIYAGEDVVEIAGVDVATVNSYTGFTVKGGLLGGSLDAATWGIDYGTSADALSEAVTGNGSRIDQFVETTEETYYVRVWASADGGENKTYSDVMTVTVKPEIIFDFSQANVKAGNLVAVGTSEGNAPIGNIAEKYETYRLMTGEDYYYFKTDSGNIPFTLYSHFDEMNGANQRIEMKYRVSGPHASGSGLHIPSAGNSKKDTVDGKEYEITPRNYYFSIPTIPGLKLAECTVWTTGNSRSFAVSEGPTYSSRDLASGSTPADTDKGGIGPDTDGLYKATIVVSDKTSVNTDYYMRLKTNGYHQRFIFRYEKVN